MAGGEGDREKWNFSVTHEGAVDSARRGEGKDRG